MKNLLKTYKGLYISKKVPYHMTKPKCFGMYTVHAIELVFIDYLNFTQRDHLIYFY